MPWRRAVGMPPEVTVSSCIAREVGGIGVRSDWQLSWKLLAVVGPPLAGR
jgi:hypothetical protein